MPSLYSSIGHPQDDLCSQYSYIPGTYGSEERFVGVFMDRHNIELWICGGDGYKMHASEQNYLIAKRIMEVFGGYGPA